MSERLTYGYQESAQDVDSSEPISVADVKKHLGIEFDAHDTTIDRLITALRREVEKRFSKSLTGKTVSVFWITFYDDLPLPYCPLATVSNLTVTDLDGETIESDYYKVYEVGGRSIFKGDFPDGLKLTYTTKALENNEDVKSRLIQSVGDCLHAEMTIETSIKKNFQNASL